jgi:hypothetical protein
MLVAQAVSIDSVSVVVLCPYCFKKHKHGSAILGSRSAHCGQGEYQIIANIEFLEKVKKFKNRLV